MTRLPDTGITRSAWSSGASGNDRITVWNSERQRLATSPAPAIRRRTRPHHIHARAALRRPLWSFLSLALLSTATAAPCLAQDATGLYARPDLNVGAAQHPNADAIILSWEQHFVIENDGSFRRRDRRWVRLMSPRANREFADPRIDYLAGRDRLVIHKAETILPDGTVMPVPEYSFNDAALDDVAGWPTWAAWQQKVISFSGIDRGAVVFLDYEVITPAGALPWLEEDLRLVHSAPVVERYVVVHLPSTTPLHYQLDNLRHDPDVYRHYDAQGRTIHRWKLTDLPAAHQEEQSPRWEERSPRLRFSTSRGAAQWVRTITQNVEKAAIADDAVRSFLEDATRDVIDDDERLRALTARIRNTIHVVTAGNTLEGWSARPAPEVLRSGYGNPLEIAALCMAALRLADQNVSVRIAVNAPNWIDALPTTSAFAGVILAVGDPFRPVLVHPERGPLPSPGSWGRKLLLHLDRTDSLIRNYLQERGENTGSVAKIAGTMTLQREGKVTGELRLSLTGAFYDPEKLETADAQKAFFSGLVQHLALGVKVTGHAITTLSRDELKATITLETDEPLPVLGGQRIFRLGEGPVLLRAFPLPLTGSQRHTDVMVNGRCQEEVELRIVFPKGVSPLVVPRGFPAVEETWGRARQQVDIHDGELRFRRSMAIDQERIPASEFDSLRRAVNDLRAEQSLLLAFPE